MKSSMIAICDSLPIVRSLRQNVSYYLLDQEGQIGAGETQVRRGDAMVFDIRGHMLVMGVGTGERRIVRMREGVDQ